MPSVSEYVNYPGLSSFYVRYGDCYVNGEKLPNVLTVVNVEAKKPGKGTFARFIMKQHMDGQDVYVECVQNPRLCSWLESNGFKKVNPVEGAEHYFRPGWKQNV